MEETKYVPKNNLHNRGYIDMYVTNGIEIKDQNYIIVEYKIIGESLYAILTQNFVTYYKQLLTGISDQETFDDTEIRERLTRLESLPQYRYDDSYLRGKVGDIEEHSAEYESTTNRRLEILESNSVRQGKSAYDLWIDQGNTGTEAEFLESLKGPEGSSGITFTPHIDENNVLSWTNDGGLENPESVELSVQAVESNYTTLIRSKVKINTKVQSSTVLQRVQLAVSSQDWNNIKVNKTLVYDDYSTIAYVTVFDGANRRITVSTVSSQPEVKNGIRLGTVATEENLPTTITQLNALDWSYANIGDFVYVLDDSLHDHGISEYYISHIDDTNASVTWEFSHSINTGNYQLPSNVEDSGKILVGGTEAGTFGESLDLDTFQKSSDVTTDGKILTGSSVKGEFGTPIDPSTFQKASSNTDAGKLLTAGSVDGEFGVPVSQSAFQKSSLPETDGKILTGSSVKGEFGTPIDPASFQQATTASLAGKILVGGDTPGTFGEPIDLSGVDSYTKEESDDKYQEKLSTQSLVHVVDDTQVSSFTSGSILQNFSLSTLWTYIRAKIIGILGNGIEYTDGTLGHKSLGVADGERKIRSFSLDDFGHVKGVSNKTIGRGLKDENDIIGHSNSSITAKTGEGLATIKHDQYGHITGSTSKILGRGLSDVSNTIGHSNAEVTAKTNTNIVGMSYDKYGHITGKGATEYTVSDTYTSNASNQLFTRHGANTFYNNVFNGHTNVVFCGNFTRNSTHSIGSNTATYIPLTGADQYRGGLCYRSGNAVYIATNGTYMIVTSGRLADTGTTTRHWYLGAGTTTMWDDSSGGTWNYTYNRHKAQSTEIRYLTAGTLIRPYVYIDSNTGTLQYVTMSVFKLNEK